MSRDMLEVTRAVKVWLGAERVVACLGVGRSVVTRFGPYVVLMYADGEGGTRLGGTRGRGGLDPWRFGWLTRASRVAGQG